MNSKFVKRNRIATAKKQLKSKSFSFDQWEIAVILQSLETTRDQWRSDAGVETIGVRHVCRLIDKIQNA